MTEEDRLWLLRKLEGWPPVGHCGESTSEAIARGRAEDRFERIKAPLSASPAPVSEQEAVAWEIVGDIPAVNDLPSQMQHDIHDAVMKALAHPAPSLTDAKIVGYLVTLPNGEEKLCGPMDKQAIFDWRERDCRVEPLARLSPAKGDKGLEGAG